MKIYRNLWASYETYFVIVGNAWTRANEARRVKVLKVSQIKGKWDIEIAEFYEFSIDEDKEHFLVVGNINLKEIIINELKKSIKG